MKLFDKEQIVEAFSTFWTNIATLFGRNNGLATLNSKGKIPLSQIDDSLFNDHIEYVDEVPTEDIKNKIYAVPHSYTTDDNKETNTLDIIGSYTTIQSNGKYVVDDNVVLSLDGVTIGSMFVSGTTVNLYTGRDFTGMLARTVTTSAINVWNVKQTVNHRDYYCGNEAAQTVTKMANVDQVEDWFIRKEQKGAPGGVAILNADGKIPVDELSFNTLVFMGLSSNLATDIAEISELASGMFFIANAEQVYNEVTYYPGDWCIWDGTSWSRQANVNVVSSVNDKVGNVMLTGDDIPVTYEGVDDTLNNTLPKLGKVKTVNGNGPDSNGNITIDTSVVIETSELPASPLNKVYNVTGGDYEYYRDHEFTYSELVSMYALRLVDSQGSIGAYYYTIGNPNYFLIDKNTGKSYDFAKLEPIPYGDTSKFYNVFIANGLVGHKATVKINGEDVSISNYTFKRKVGIYSKNIQLATKSDLDTKANSDNVVTLDGDQTISGSKTFSSNEFNANTTEKISLTSENSVGKSELSFTPSTLVFGYVSKDEDYSENNSIRASENRISMFSEHMGSNDHTSSIILDGSGIDINTFSESGGAYARVNTRNIVTSVNDETANDDGELYLNNLGKINESITKQWTPATFSANSGFQIGGGSSTTKGMSPNNIYVDTGSNGKWLERSDGSWAVQINAGTSFYVPVVTEGTITVTYYNQGTKTYSVNTGNMVAVSGYGGKFYKIDCTENDYIGTITYSHTTDFALKTVGKNVEVLGDLTLRSNSIIGYGKPDKMYTSGKNMSNIFPQNGTYIADKTNETSGIHINGDNIVMWTPGDNGYLKIYDEDNFTSDNASISPVFEVGDGYVKNNGDRLMSASEWEECDDIRVNWLEATFTIPIEARELLIYLTDDDGDSPHITYYRQIDVEALKNYVDLIHFDEYDEPGYMGHFRISDYNNNISLSFMENWYTCRLSGTAYEDHDGYVKILWR